ncbi:TfoX/Sxy family DNA transformation protein [Vibrio sp. MarTm2]|jgi:DNA transformation protein|uniref:DNA transformation protein n=2 Tax=Vibrio TaxID=662 RepID=A0A0A5HU85_PHOS4|nr:MULTISPECIES: TfoX/Sxy family DNA transformation protein [Vibrio]KGY07071.1 DNA transformation protein [Vibrio sinaloensis]KHD24910.1 DNA transformation protein [Vibrio caribbeanicus]KHT44826.1 DNA transformation protein [Vibrio sinaloensis]KHT45055.1 DNA transformation protein [Vibrio sinaloensis]MDA0127585.1 TfoX/Sxy family DNA transformation protein [Vibrio sp. MarTm2]
MDKPILKDSMRLFEQLGQIKSRSMFGGFGIFADETMFALVVNDKLHVRADAQLIKQCNALSLEPYVYKKRGFPVVTKYFALSDDISSDNEKTLALARQALIAAKEEKKVQSKAKPNRLKDLPNLRLATERMLKKAGIDDVESLEEAGAVKAYKAIQSTHSAEVSVELLWALEGAIKGTHWSVIPQSRRQELLNKLSN